MWWNSPNRWVLPLAQWHLVGSFCQVLFSSQAWSGAGIIRGACTTGLASLLSLTFVNNFNVHCCHPHLTPSWWKTCHSNRHYHLFLPLWAPLVLFFTSLEKHILAQWNALSTRFPISRTLSRFVFFTASLTGEHLFILALSIGSAVSLWLTRQVPSHHPGLRLPWAGSPEVSTSWLARWSAIFL